MRKIYHIAAILTLAMASCQKTDELPIAQNNTDKVFYATFENEADISTGTRTSLDSDNKVLWSEGDEITIFEGSTINNAYVLNEGAGTTRGTFVAKQDQPSPTFINIQSLNANVAYYPYNSGVTVSENVNSQSFTINATLPTTQTFSASDTFESGASPMVAVTSIVDKILKFKNVGSIFRVQLKGAATITKIEFSADAYLAGDCSITASNSAAPSVNVTNGSNTITLNCGEGVTLNNDTPTNFIVAMFPVEIEEGGITITIHDNTGKKMIHTYKASEPISIQRSRAYSTEVLTFMDAVTAAQTALDNATNGVQIRLQPGVNYGTLVFRQNSGSRVVDITTMGGDAAGNEHYSKYEAVEILGAPGAIVDQIDFQVGWIDDRQGASFIEMKNISLNGITFSGEKTAINLEGSKGSCLGIDGLSIVNCKMNDADGNNRLVFQQITGYKDLTDKGTNEKVMTTGVKNLGIRNCEVTGANMVIESRAMENLYIKDNTFTGIKQRDMLITSDTSHYPDVTYTGEITITGNTSIGGEERFVRASLNNSAATVNISNNTIIDYKGADPDYIKVSGHDSVNGTLTIENNTFTINVSTTDNLEMLILKAIDNTTFQLGVGNYSELDFTHTPDGSKITAKNITIQGVNGTIIPNLIFPEGGNNVIDWKIANISFNGSRGIDVRSGGNNLTVENCQFSNGAKIYASNDFDNIIVKQCGFNASGTGGVYFQGVTNVNIQQCSFTNMPYNAIQLSGTGVAGNISITDNTISNCTSRAMRIVTKAGAVLNISNNTMTNSNNANDDTISDRGQIIKITGSVVEGTFENNTHNGDEITFTDGIAKVIHD